MSEAFWQIQSARTAGYYIGKESLDVPMSKTKRLKMQAQRKGFKQGERSMGKPLTKDEVNTAVKIAMAEVGGEQKGELSMDNEQIDNVSENSDGLTIIGKAGRAWRKWAEDNNISAINTQPETYQLMQEAFIDGYTNGFVKRFTEGA